MAKWNLPSPEGGPPLSQPLTLRCLDRRCYAAQYHVVFCGNMLDRSVGIKPEIKPDFCLAFSPYVHF